MGVGISTQAFEADSLSLATPRVALDFGSVCDSDSANEILSVAWNQVFPSSTCWLKKLKASVSAGVRTETRC